MPRRVSDERKRFWRDLVERQPTSGLNIARFCADAGVSQNAFYVWKKRLLTPTQQVRAAPPRRKHRRTKAAAKSLVVETAVYRSPRYRDLAPRRMHLKHGTLIDLCKLDR